MAQPLDLGKVHRMRAGCVGMGKTTAGDETLPDRQLSFGFIKIDALDKPGRVDTKSGFKQLIGHDCNVVGMAESVILPHSASPSITAPISASRVRCAALRAPLT